MIFENGTAVQKNESVIDNTNRKQLLGSTYDFPPPCLESLCLSRKQASDACEKKGYKGLFCIFALNYPHNWHASIFSIILTHAGTLLKPNLYLQVSAKNSLY